MIKKYKHIIWDWNGTLLNDVDLCVDIINGILSKRDLNILSGNEYKDIFTFPVSDYYKKAGLDFNRYPFEVLGIEWMNEYEKRRTETCLFEGAKDVLKYISNTGISQSILSAYPLTTLIEIVHLYGLEHYFSYISGLDHIYATSKIETGKKLINKIGLAKKDLVLIGDTIHDFDVANEIGAECILIANGHQSKARLLGCGVPVVDSLFDLRIS